MKTRNGIATDAIDSATDANGFAHNARVAVDAAGSAGVAGVAKSGRSLLTCVWACVLVLSLLVVASVSSMGAYADTYASRDPEVLFLDAATGDELSGTMDLFASSYTNASGQTMVASANGDKVVAPGASGSYAFSVRNSGGQPAAYNVWAEATQQGSNQAIPLKLRLVSGMRECGDLADSGQLAPGSCAVYRIAWEWPFEQSAAPALAAADAADTALGQQSAEQPASYTVAVHMTAQANDASAANASAANANYAKTGDAAAPVAIVALLAAAAAIAAALWARRARRAGASRAGKGAAHL